MSPVTWIMREPLTDDERMKVMDLLGRSRLEAHEAIELVKKERLS